MFWTTLTVYCAALSRVCTVEARVSYYPPPPSESSWFLHPSKWKLTSADGVFVDTLSNTNCALHLMNTFCRYTELKQERWKMRRLELLAQWAFVNPVPLRATTSSSLRGQHKYFGPFFQWELFQFKLSAWMLMDSARHTFLMWLDSEAAKQPQEHGTTMFNCGNYSLLLGLKTSPFLHQIVFYKESLLPCTCSAAPYSGSTHCETLGNGSLTFPLIMGLFLRKRHIPFVFGVAILLNDVFKYPVSPSMLRCCYEDEGLCRCSRLIRCVLQKLTWGIRLLTTP